MKTFKYIAISLFLLSGLQMLAYTYESVYAPDVSCDNCGAYCLLHQGTQNSWCGSLSNYRCYCEYFK